MKKLENKVEVVTVVDGVVLTPDAIQTLQGLQEHNNSMLNADAEIIADAVCFLSVRLDGYDGVELKTALNLISELSMIRDEIKRLAKP